MWKEREQRFQFFWPHLWKCKVAIYKEYFLKPTQNAVSIVSSALLILSLRFVKRFYNLAWFICYH